MTRLDNTAATMRARAPANDPAACHNAWPLGTAALPVLAGLGLMAGLASGDRAEASPSNLATTTARVSFASAFTGLNTNDFGAAQSSDPGTFVSADAFASDGFSGLGEYLGGAEANATAIAGDRFTKAFSSAGLISAYSEDEMLIPPTYANATSIWTSIARPTGTGNVNINALFQRQLTFNDFLSFEDRLADFQNAVQINYAPPYSLFTDLTSESLFELSVNNIATGDNWKMIFTDKVYRSYNAFDFLEGASLTDGIQVGYSQLYFTSLVNGFATSEEQVLPEENLLKLPEDIFSSTYSVSGFDFASMPIFLDASQDYEFTMSLSCTSQISYPLYTSLSPPIMSTGCNAGNSGYWAGLSDFRDVNGNAIAPFGLTEAGTGLDISGPSPSFPAVDPIPEPASWAMLIAGFGLVGTVQRRRRQRASAAWQ